MCSLTTALTIGSTLFGAYQANQQAKAQAKAIEAAAAYNIVDAKNRAQDVKNKGVFAENQQRLKTQRMLAAQQVGFAANGVDLSSGSAAMIQNDTLNLGEIDALQIRDNYLLQADAISRQADLNYANSMFSAGQERSQGRSQLIGGLLTAGGQIVSSKWYKDRTIKTPTKRYDIHSDRSLNEQRFNM